MELIKILHLSKSTATKPRISFSLAGQIRINHLAMQKICPECYKSKDTFYIHFYNDNKKLYIEANKLHDDGLPLRFDGGNKDRRNAKNVSASGKLVIKHLAEMMDWPLGENKLKVIRYQIGNEAKKGIFELV